MPEERRHGQLKAAGDAEWRVRILRLYFFWLYSIKRYFLHQVFFFFKSLFNVGVCAHERVCPCACASVCANVCASVCCFKLCASIQHPSLLWQCSEEKLSKARLMCRRASPSCEYWHLTVAWHKLLVVQEYLCFLPPSLSSAPLKADTCQDLIPKTGFGSVSEMVFLLRIVGSSLHCRLRTG